MGAFLYGPVHGFMLWNLFLAAVPARPRARRSSRRSGRRGVPWWVGLVAWVLFLPNAPYVLTDVVHMVHDIRNCALPTRQAYLVIATYGVLFAARPRVVRVLAAVLPPVPASARSPTGSSRRSMLSVHALCVFAMYLGRVVRLNSWDVVTAPSQVAAVVASGPDARSRSSVLAVMFVVVGVAVFVAVAVGDKPSRTPPTALARLVVVAGDVPAAEVDGPRVDDGRARGRDRRRGACGRDTRRSGRRAPARPSTRSPTLHAPCGVNVRCSSEQNNTSASSMVGLPWSMPIAFSPQSATDQRSFTWITVATIASARRERQAELAVVAVHERVRARLDLGGRGVDVVGTGAAGRHDVAADGLGDRARRRSIAFAVIASRSARSATRTA